MEATLTKSEFASLMHVGRSTVSEWIRRGKIFGAALAGSGYSARIRPDIAKEQLRRYLDDTGGRATSIPVANKPSPGGFADVASGRVIEDRIKDQRHIALTARAGKYVLATDASQEMGRMASRLLTVFEATLNEFANALMVAGAPKDTLKILKATWNEVRTREATACTVEATQIEQFMEIEQ